jgi:Adenosine-deaminase (editase) domain
MKSCMSLLNSLLSTIIDPATCYLDHIIVPQQTYHADGVERAFQKRLAAIDTKNWPTSYRKQPIKVLTTNLSIPETLLSPQPDVRSSSTTCSSCLIHVPGRRTEVLINGVKMGSRFPPTLKGASCVCRAMIAQAFVDLAIRRISIFPFAELSPRCSYASLKEAAIGWADTVKPRVREGLGGWTSNERDNDFTVEIPLRSHSEL